DVQGAEGRAQVPRARLLDGDERGQPARVGEQGERSVAIGVGRAEAIELGLRDQAEIRHRLETVADAPTVLRPSGDPGRLRSRAARTRARPAPRTRPPRRPRETSTT